MRKLALLTLLLSVPLLAADSYVLRLGDIAYMNGKGMSGQSLDRLRSAHGRRFFWFKRDGRTYVVTGATELERAEAIVRPQSELGKKQAALGQKQAALGTKQAEIGGQQGELGMRQASAAGDERRQEALSREQEKLSRKQEELSRQQEVLSRQQDKLSEEQDRLSVQVEKQLAELADRCVRTGAAKEVWR